jgi:hypothetical protein
MSDIIDKVLFGSRIIVTGSPAFRFNSFTHFLGKDNTNVDLPVNCIFLTSLPSIYVVNSV